MRDAWSERCKEGERAAVVLDGMWYASRTAEEAGRMFEPSAGS